ncbi:hypothetical protein QZM47_28135, partial [Burkholderia cepacia]|uniref:hypothetical protein n=1 Tax=Burkholderia cepacia TaxID=292 RepID=UPI00264F61F9
QASLGFLQDADDLLFGESLFHCRPSLERTLHRHRTKRGEQVTDSPRLPGAPNRNAWFSEMTDIIRDPLIYWSYLRSKPQLPPLRVPISDVVHDLPSIVDYAYRMGHTSLPRR